MSSMEVGELIYEYHLKITGITEYGCSFGGLLAGEHIPAEGARFDVWFEGPVTGDKLSGTAKGVDYLYIRPDGRFELNIRAEITTKEGKKVSLAADGVALPQQGKPVVELRENVTLFSSESELKWVNPLQVWGTGQVDIAAGEIHIRGYSA